MIRYLLMLLTLALCLSFVTPADATTYRGQIGGATCQGNSATERGYTFYSDEGISNVSASSELGITCTGIAAPGSGLSYVVSYMSLNYRDRNGNATGGDLYCWPTGHTYTWGYIAGSTMHSCSTGGGCPNPTTGQFTGFLNWTNPFGTSAYAWTNVTVRCGVPPTYGGNASQVGATWMEVQQ